MPPGASEPEKYTIDEIMDRLKQTSSGVSPDGEMVTRSDGSQAIRVRKRKRRTSQPHKEEQVRNRRLRVFQVVGVLVLLFVAAVGMGAAIIYANSAPFRAGLEDKIKRSAGAAIELQQFRMNPQTANASNLTMAWPAGNVLKSLTMRGLTAEISPSSFFGKSFNGEEIIAQESTLTLQFPQPGQPRFNQEVDAELPIQFARYRSPTFHLVIDDGSTTPLHLERSEASLWSQTFSGLPQMRLYRGDLMMAGWPTLRVENALFEFHGSETEVIALRLLHGKADEHGTAELAGTLSLFEPDHTSSLSIKLDDFLLSGLAGDALGNLVSGRVDTTAVSRSNFLSFSPNSKPNPVLDVTFHNADDSDIQVKGFPFLTTIGLNVGDDWYKEPKFDTEAVGVLHREGGAVSLRDIRFISKAKIMLNGTLTVGANQQLSGTLSVGLSETLVGSSKDAAFRAVFGPARDGIQWVNLKISGPATAPADNLDQLMQAIKSPQNDASAPEATPKSMFEELTKPR